MEESSAEETDKAAQPEIPTTAPPLTPDQAPNPAPAKKIDLAGVFAKKSKFSSSLPADTEYEILRPNDLIAVDRIMCKRDLWKVGDVARCGEDLAGMIGIKIHLKTHQVEFSISTGRELAPQFSVTMGNLSVPKLTPKQADEKILELVDASTERAFKLHLDELAARKPRESKKSKPSKIKLPQSQSQSESQLAEAPKTNRTRHPPSRYQPAAGPSKSATSNHPVESLCTLPSRRALPSREHSDPAIECTHR